MMGTLTFLCLFFFSSFFFLRLLELVDFVCSMWGKIMIPMYRFWLHNLYGIYGPHCLLSGLLNLITESLTQLCVQTSLLAFCDGNLTNWIILQNWYITGHWNSLPRTSSISTLHTVNIVAAGDLAMQGSRASATMVLPLLYRNILVSAPEGLMSLSKGSALWWNTMGNLSLINSSWWTEIKYVTCHMDFL